MHKQLILLREKKYAKRKVARAISVKQFNHVILKANRPVLRKNHRIIKRLLRETQLRYGIRLKSIAIVENHIHFLIQTSTRTAFANAFRFFAGQVALKIGAGKLWKQRLWSRVVRYGRDLRLVVDYILQNPVKEGVLSAAIDLYRIEEGILQV